MNNINILVTGANGQLGNQMRIIAKYYYSNEGVCSWCDFTKMIAQYNGTTACDVQPCHSSEFPSPVKRPSYSVLDKTKIKEVFGVKVPYWTDSVAPWGTILSEFVPQGAFFLCWGTLSGNFVLRSADFICKLGFFNISL